MKRIVILVMVIAATMTSVHAEEFLGVQVGFAQSISRLNTPVTKDVLNPTNYNGMKVGLVYDATWIKGFGVTMGLNYTFGANTTDWAQQYPNGGNFPQIRSQRQYHQLEIPVDWQYKFEIAQRTWLILYTGPTLQCGLSFQNKDYTRNDYNSKGDNPKVKNYYSEADMKDYALKRINVTWGIGAGFQYERYFLRGGYDFGLINPYKAQSFSNEDINTRGHFDQWQIKLGMYFWER